MIFRVTPRGAEPYNTQMIALAHSGAIERMLHSEIAPEVARTVLLWSFAEADQLRLSELSAKARMASLSADESRELDWYLLLGDFLTILQSKARVALRKHSSAA
jgi:hypothetical protein